eukprot:11159096-Lingulodinium_polyedra.AAC.1
MEATYDVYRSLPAPAALVQRRGATLEEQEDLVEAVVVEEATWGGATFLLQKESRRSPQHKQPVQSLGTVFRAQMATHPKSLFEETGKPAFSKL